ncbi:FecR family protein [Membranihabitans maritimus]|uniref:FecR family protein n=1 Tax=Membranihabitans maritimus TaxID=2904244 RepID=UPI001F376403|nr:FecR family protein [Membranihabitans maritimus]
MHKDYRFYSVEDFIYDTEFRKYILDNDVEQTHFWNTLSKENSELKSRMDEASSILRSLNGLYLEYEKEGRKKAIPSYLELVPKLEKKSKTNTKRTLAIISIAASLLLLITVIFFLVTSKDAVEYYTDKNQSEEIMLPDGSIVYLGENSHLKIAPEWNENHRHVSLEGTAYFMVRPIKSDNDHKVKFTVSTKGPNVEVLGTQFNVYSSDSLTNIILDEGSVKLIPQGQQGAESLLIPGQMAIFNPKTKTIEVSNNPNQYKETYKRPETIEFNHITLRKAIDKMETVFGVKFLLKDPEINGLDIDKLSVPSDNPETFIKTIEILFNEQIEITKDSVSNTIVINPKK